MRRLELASFSVTGSAIRQVALSMGLADPAAMADELLGTDVEALHDWFGLAARTQLGLWRGVARLSDAFPLLAAGWSSPGPRLAVSRQHDAGLASRGVISRQVDAAEAAIATLRQSRYLADVAVSEAEGAVRRTGWPPGEDLLAWATDQHRVLEVEGIVAGLCHQLEDLRSRNTEALRTLAAALRADPRDPVDLIASGPRSPAGSTAATNRPYGPASVTGIDGDNLNRLAQDLRSTDVATLAMALGVSAALEKASTEGGGVAQLLVYESANSGSEGRAAISVGDVTTADNVAILAPGIANAPSGMADGISDAAALRNEAQRQSPGDATAVVSWYGYDIPLSALTGVPNNPASTLANIAAALDDGNAREGGALLTGDIDQFHEWAPDAARFVTVGFSMGSTTVSAAAARGARVDDMVLLGSPGASNDVDTAADYPGLPAEHTFVVAYEQDAVTRPATDLLAGLAGGFGPLPGHPSPFGPDPAGADFGAQVIDVQTNTTPAHLPELPFLPLNRLANDVLELAATHQEANYLSGESLRAVGAVVNGQYTQVPIKAGR